MRITLNLASRPFTDLAPIIKQLRIAMAALAVVALGMGLILHVLHSKAEAARARNHSLDSQIARIVQERQSYQELMRQPANAQLVAQVGALNSLFDEKAFSWTLAMEDLETVLPARVQVSNLEPVRAKDGNITLQLRVIGPRDLGLELVSNLEHSKRFVFPRIVGESTESLGGPNDKLEPVSLSNRVNFDLLADYNPATPEERKAMRAPATRVADSDSAPTETHAAVQPPRRPAFQSRPAHQPNISNAVMSPSDLRRAGQPRYATPPTSKPTGIGPSTTAIPGMRPLRRPPMTGQSLPAGSKRKPVQGGRP